MIKKEEILAKTNNGLDVFKHYLGSGWRVGRNFLNPLYEDKKASCNIYYDRKYGIYRMKDFGNADYSGDCFFLVGRLKGLDCGHSTDFIEILETIDRDMGLYMSEASSTLPLPRGKALADSPEVPAEKKYRNYMAIEQPFTDNEIDFWLKSGIEVDLLKRYKTISLKEYRSENKDGHPFVLTSSRQEMMFAYVGKKHIKVYRPFSKMRFVYGGGVEEYCFGLEQLPPKGDILFITGGEKDVMSLAAHGFSAICFNSETVTIPKHIIAKLAYRFKHIVLLYDADKTGRESACKHERELAEFGVKRLELPLAGTKEEKDISDYFSLGHTKEELRRLFLDLLENLYGNTLSLLKSCEIDFSHPPANAGTIISADDIPLGTEGNLLCVSGGEGTGKSHYMSALIAGAIRNPGKECDTLGISVRENNPERAVLLYDTEQSEQQLYKNIAGMLRRAGIEEMPYFLRTYCLTGMSRKERLQAIIRSMDTFYFQYHGIHLVVIDGIADLIRCANDEGESVGLIDELYRLAGIYKTCIACVLHLTPSGLKLRGHLGSELQRKAAAILSLEKDENPLISVVKAIKVRDGSPLDVPMMQFGWDKQAGMMVYKGEKPREEHEKRKERELTALAAKLFKKQRSLSYSELCRMVQENLDVKERTAKNYIRFMREKKIITQEDQGNTYLLIHTDS